MISSDEIQMRAQRSLQEYEDAVENLDPRFAELGRACVAALDEFIAYWNERPESPASREAHESSAGAGEAGAGAESDMTEYVARQLEWARHERERVLSQLSKDSAGAGSGR
ncbi:MAG TPA: hypothetical protein VM864_06235 [Pyrinomonadaceae bacterium]|jgi:hypothetical protein|nr:hypothetical protein [Pyrinomonadaceae bacterium]